MFSFILKIQSSSVTCFAAHREFLYLNHTQVSNGISGICEHDDELLPENAESHYLRHFEESYVFATDESHTALFSSAD
jgi:hypothetical protein